MDNVIKDLLFIFSEKLNDPLLYCTVLDAAKARRGEEDLYCAPIYSDPNQQQQKHS